MIRTIVIAVVFLTCLGCVANAPANKQKEDYPVKVWMGDESGKYLIVTYETEKKRYIVLHHKTSGWGDAGTSMVLLDVEEK